MYAAWFTVLGRRRSPGRSSRDSGTRPGLRRHQRRSPGATRTVEAFVLDKSADLYGQHVAVDFVSRIRGMEPFANVGDLIAEMNRDVEKTRVILDAADS